VNVDVFYGTRKQEVVSADADSGGNDEREEEE